MRAIQYGGEKILYHIERGTRVKTVRIYIDSSGRIIVYSPQTLLEEKIQEIIRKKARWIFERQNLLKSQDQNDNAKEFVSGESFHYLGHQYRLKVIKSAPANGQGECRIINGRFQVEVDGTLAGESLRKAVRGALKAWYWEHAVEKIKERVEQYARQIEKRPGCVNLKEQKKRWGSCSKDGQIRLNWKIIMLPISLLDYVIVHELCHMNHPHHSIPFWQEVQKIMPDYKKKREDLKANNFVMNQFD